MSTQNLLDGFCGCEKHCWCAYSEDDLLIVKLEAAHIVRLMKTTEHDHSPNLKYPNGCPVCALEERRIEIK